MLDVRVSFDHNEPPPADDTPPPYAARAVRSRTVPEPSPAVREPQRSTQAEQSVLGALLLDPAAFADVSGVICAADFFDRAHGAIFTAIETLISHGGAVDMVTVFEQLQAAGKAKDCGGLPYLNELWQCVPSAANAGRYAEIVAKCAALRALAAAADSLSEQAFAAAADPGAVLDAAKSALGAIELRRKLPRRGVPLLGLGALRETAEAVRWLVKRVIPADSIGMVFGGSGTFKSFIALDASLHVAHGLPWLGRRTQRGPVIYIAAEGGSGLWSRINAWHRARNLRPEDAQMFVVPVAVDLQTDAWRVVEAAQMAGVSPSLVVVDTLSQTYSGEENSANEMAAYLRELGVRFRALWACAVLLIHHSGHLATERPRGSSAIRANLDFLFGVHRDEKEMLATLGCQKQKDGEQFADATFALTKVDLGADEDGDRLSSLVARHLSSAEEVEEAMAEECRAGRAGRNQQLLRLVQNGMPEKDLRRAFQADCCGDMDSESASRVYRRAKNWAMSAGYFEVAQGTVITLRRPS